MWQNRIFFFSQFFLLNGVHTHSHKCAHTHTHTFPNDLFRLWSIPKENNPKRSFRLWQSIEKIQRPIWKCKLLSCVQLFASPWAIQSMEFSRPEYWSGFLSLLQGIFPTQALNLGLPQCWQILYQLSHKGSPRPI